ncbi:hypothetical protein Scep_010549 [Stephania cephalantha]|uniref:Protein kinase domain-containing protein n=1 Tax=Stephania cephalantha TaxID=152367 RepID=A0AAP0JWK2_9MAGN
MNVMNITTATTAKYLPLEFTPSRRSTGSTNLQWNSSKNQLQPQTISRLNSSDDKKGDLIIPSSLPTTIDRTSSVRRAMSLTIKRPLAPPPLCSVCQRNAPIFGKRPMKYSYQEIQRATNGFSSANFLAEGGYGPVFRGVMPDGQVVAVKQHKSLSAQGASEFCSEIEVLSCAQHRNLVMLVGYCIEKEWLLVYQFACNGSLDKHLYDEYKGMTGLAMVFIGTETSGVMTWQSRMKVAVGAARGLRYLHEDCRVGCVIHRDMRPKNILLTHDFEPMVGDFGLARWQADGQSAEETRVIGSFGYLAPEYTQTGLITEKADVYAFGVVLLELLSGLKATDLIGSEERHYLPEWGLRLCKKNMLGEILDPRLMGEYVDAEVESMMLAASLCIGTSPEKRPRMSKVLRILEGEMPRDMAYEHGGSIPKMKNSCGRRSFHETRELCTSHRVKLMHRAMESSMNIIVNNSEHNKVETMPTYLEKFGVNKVNSSWNMEQTEDFHSAEFQAYLKGSLANTGRSKWRLGIENIQRFKMISGKTHVLSGSRIPAVVFTNPFKSIQKREEQITEPKGKQATPDLTAIC